MTDPSIDRTSVVIITMNRRALVERTLPVLLDDEATSEIVVVIDGGTDDTLSMLEEWARRDSRVRPVWQENAGEGAARQRGAELATGDVVVFLDDDVEPSADLISAHARRHRVGDVQLVLGYMPTTVPTPRRRGQVATELYAADYEAACRRYEEDPRNIWTSFWGGNFSMRREDAVRIGLRGQLRFTYHEDVYFGIRCREAGLLAAFDRTARARHTHSRNLRRLAREARRSGEARAILVNWYPDLRELFDPLSSLTGSQRRLVMAASGSARPVVVAVLMTMCWVFGVAHAWRLETQCARVMRHVDLVHSFRVRQTTPIEARRP